MTGKIARIAVVVAALSLGAFAQANQTAAAPAVPKIGILNIQAAVANCNEGQRDLLVLDKKMEPKVNELRALQAEAENLTKQISTQGDKLNPEAKASLDKQLQTKSTQFQRGREDYQADLQAQEQELFQRIYPKVMQSVDGYAKANGYTLILDWGVLQNGVTWAANGIDITADVIAAYNTASGVPAPPPQAGGAPAKPATSTAKQPAPAAKPAPKP
jgi:Skp family chaperone for outer membrane proteins